MIIYQCGECGDYCRKALRFCAYVQTSSDEHDGERSDFCSIACLTDWAADNGYRDDDGYGYADENQADVLRGRWTRMTAKPQPTMHRDIAVVTSAHCYEIRQLHQRSAYGSHCRECNRIYPCPTIQILDRRGLQ